jgi:hypothetical protein
LERKPGGWNELRPELPKDVLRLLIIQDLRDLPGPRSYYFLSNEVRVGIWYLKIMKRDTNGMQLGIEYRFAQIRGLELVPSKRRFLIPPASG